MGKYLIYFLFRLVWNKELLFRHSFYKFALEYAIGKVQGNQGSLILDKNYEIRIYAEDVSLLGEDVQTAGRKSEALLVASQGIWFRSKGWEN